MVDSAPTVCDEDGNPMKLRVVGHECVGRVDRGMFGYTNRSTGEQNTVYFEEVNNEGQ